METAVPNTANKNLLFVKTMIDTVNDNLQLGLDISHLFRKIILPDEEQFQRPPFDHDYLLNTLLNPSRLVGLNDQAKAALYIIAETGVGFTEQVGLSQEDIKLDCDIPHIVITSGKGKSLKTKYRKRTIPLIGYALDTFKKFPDGLTEYRDRPDSLSATISKFLRENNLLPTDRHTAYSLRHNFQDRLLAVNTPDRVQADLMGHKFQRQAYGNGASLQQKYEYLLKIQLK